MQKARKFGTFGGVYTPSLLTILGVIMYLRLGWIVGQAGLITTVAIILIAHIISITTGLSLSSISTDKKIKAGGIYYMLSRSLGLAIGGAIGATLFLAMALSISLYIVGFSESFLAIDRIREVLHLDSSVDSIRIIGGGVLVILTLIAFISTSLAIKIQYFVLTAIALSLVSIFAGLFYGTEFLAATPSLTPVSGAPSPEVLFAIFFPAVTGFTVGVAMSGDLKDPKGAIPKGTLLAIFTGMIIYLAMAFGFAFFADRQLLLEDSTFLLKISMVPVLVLAGIWGATLSSALGSILGGPRIAQAMARDRLAPSLLGKGFGINNEPRSAIILTFFIALAGILIGDLNTIARVVSMFFITAYGFINLAFALESWASTDFRPTFRIPRWVGWLGFGASMLVMIQIDIFAMIIAFILIWLTWFFMKKREQALDSNDDVWQSVWSSVVRHALQKMDKRSIEERNWKPNIMLFSGNPHTRPHLLELGKALIANHGLLTLINLQKFPAGEKPRSRFRQIQKKTDKLSEKGVFSRDYFCTDIYDGIENLTETYGFSGVEPNTVFMGWARQSSDSLRFARLIKHIIQLDLNILLMDYDSQKGFGKRKLIDIWWRGSGNNGNLAINLVKFLWLADEWKDSKTRLMIENPVNGERENIISFAREVLDTLRVNAEIIIINNEIEKKPFYDIIRAESAESDIIFLGIPEIEETKEIDFVEQTHALCNDLGTVVLLKASTQFKRLNIGIKFQPMPKLAAFPEEAEQEIRNIRWPKNPQSAAFVNSFYNQTAELGYELRVQSFGKILYQYADILSNAQNRVNTTFGIIEKKLAGNSENNIQEEIATVLFKLTVNTFSRYEQILLNIRDSFLAEQEKNLDIFFRSFREKTQAIISSLPEHIIVDTAPEDLNYLSTDSIATHFYKWRIKIKGADQAKEKINIRKLVQKLYPNTWYLIRQKLWEKFSSLSLQYIIEQQKAFKQLSDSLHVIETALAQKNFSLDLLKEEKSKIDILFVGLQNFLLDSEKAFQHLTEEENKHAIQEICDVLDHYRANHYIAKYKNPNRLKNFQQRFLDTYPAAWARNQELQINFNMLEITLSSVEYKFWRILDKTSAELQEFTHPHHSGSPLLSPDYIVEFAEQAMAKLEKKQTLPQPDFKTEKTDTIYQRIKDIEDDTLERLSLAVSRIPSQAELPKRISSADLISLQTSDPETEKIEVSRLIHFIAQNDLISPLQQSFRYFAQQITQIEAELLEIARLMKISLTGDKEEAMELPDTYFFAEQINRAQTANQKLIDLRTSVDDKLRNILNKTAGKLSPTVFLKTAENLKLYAKTREKEEKKANWLSIKKNLLRSKFRLLLVKIWFDRSRRLVYAQRIRTAESEDFFPISQLHALNEKVSVEEKILVRIPPYYQQLFLRKNNYFMDFWQGKTRELEEAGKIIKRHEKGYNGALLIKGEHNSGKTFMANYICHKYLSTRNVFVVHPPYAGSVSGADFLHALQKATEKQMGLPKLMKTLPDKSVIVIEDLELWWEKTNDGLDVISLICNLIEKHGSKILFILNVNQHAYNSISRFKKLDPWLLGTITCHPFNAEELRNIITQRHNAGNMKFVYNGKKENEMRSWDYARLFNTYFNYSRGNIGLSLQAWMASIGNVKDNTLFIHAPRRPDLSVLNKLNAETLVLLVQFILHKRLNFEKTERVMILPAGEVREKIIQLKRAALIIEPNPGVFILNPTLHPFIRERLLEKELL